MGESMLGEDRKGGRWWVMGVMGVMGFMGHFMGPRMEEEGQVSDDCGDVTLDLHHATDPQKLSSNGHNFVAYRSEAELVGPATGRSHTSHGLHGRPPQRMSNIRLRRMDMQHASEMRPRSQ